MSFSTPLVKSLGTRTRGHYTDPVLRLSSLLALIVAGTALVAGACAPNDAGPIGGPIFNGTTPEGNVIEPPITTLPPPGIEALRVPAEYFTIQEAVNAAQPGDLVLIDPGVYSEEVTIRNADVIVRGRNRETVFVDGLHALGTGFTVLADGVAIENLTVRNYTLDAIAIGEEVASGAVPVNRARVGYVTTSNTGRFGVVSRRASTVEVTNAWTSGHGGAGVSIENCSPCNTVVHDSVVEFSARGFSFTGTDSAVSLVNSASRNNRVGIVVEDGEVPATGVVVAGNNVLNNGFSNTPQIDPANDHGFGAGIHVVGTTGTTIIRNRIAGNIGTGILLGSSPGAAVIPKEIILDGNVFDAPDGSEIVDLAEGDTWNPIPASSIPYVNGPVPQDVFGMSDVDDVPGVPAGAVQQPQVDIVTVPSG